MTLTAETSTTSKLSLVAKGLSDDGGQEVATFGKALFADVDATELNAYSEQDLMKFAAVAFDAFRQRKPHEIKIVLTPFPFATGQILVVDIVNDDMPFLLDSVLGQLRDLGFMPELVSHPVFEVQRDDQGRIVSLAPAHGEPNGRSRESHIHLHIRRTTGKERALEIEAALRSVLADVKTAVSDFHRMEERLGQAIAQLEANSPPATLEVNAESVQFLRWLLANNFIFLGVREYSYEGNPETGELTPRPEKSLGLLRNPAISVLRRGGEQQRLTAESRAFFLNSPPIIVAKANSKSTVHRRVHFDSVGIKLYDQDKRITGELRIVGLFTASVYNVSTRSIPLLRLKIDDVSRRLGYAPDGYSVRALFNVLETFPRDEMFQITPEQLAYIADEILKIELNPRPRVFIRRDEFGRFASAFVFVPRERYNTDVRIRIAKLLEDKLGGRFESFTPFFPESAMVRIHFLIWRGETELLSPEEQELEAGVERIVRTWSDEFEDLVYRHYGDEGARIIERYGSAFPAGYQETNGPLRALEDIQRLEKLSADRPTDIDFYRPNMGAPEHVRATLQQIDEPITLSKRVPILENFGFNVVSERTFGLTPRGVGAHTVYLHDTDLRFIDGGASELSSRSLNLENGFVAVWAGLAQNDRLNGLILGAGLSWRQVAVIRAYTAYLRQTGAPFGLAYVSQVLNKYPGIAADIFSLFDAKFDPSSTLDMAERIEQQKRQIERISAKLDKIPVLDEDRILRSFVTMIKATLRTNFYHRTEKGAGPETIAFKFRSAEIDWLPAPKPYAEIFVYGTRFEGVHLRAGPVARGGLRWSDRPQDFRTEILGLVKAQQVKNVVIVPQGAKGGFVPRNLPTGNREAVQAEGVACYKSFISTLLSITDNLVQGQVVPPADTVRFDNDDPYLVVAADKGTATFSDIANEIAVGRKFWLGDAFASGGSVGYDHKKMGITAKGAWEAVKRHFREMNIDIQKTPFTVAGVGDMSGDVFGNGMLLSPAIRLVAAFDHRDIFIDPNPDPVIGFHERQRLFDLPRSSWQDYDKSKISEGGGVFSRSEKYIELSPQAQALLQLKAHVTPNEVMTAILKLPVDLMWFGGIGTFIRAAGETDLQVGDRANDAIRITASDVRAKVIGEGANLGVTQRGRIEYAMKGGRINTDAIDNSAGVNTSDVEVNLKIALGGAVTAGKLTLDERNALLASMTDEVGAAVLRNNYLQTLAISQTEQAGLLEIGFQQRFVQKLEKDGTLDRALEYLPSDAAFAEREAQGKPLTRPELAILLAYAKIDLERRLLKSAVPDDPYLGRELVSYFPPLMRQRFAAEIESHPLRREIIATTLTNAIINRGGPSFVMRLAEETGYPTADVAYAFAAARAAYRFEGIYDAIDALDNKIDGKVQLELYRIVQRHLRNQTGWFLRHGAAKGGLEEEITRYREGVSALSASLSEILPPKAAARLKNHAVVLQKSGVPEQLAQQIASLDFTAQALDIVRVSQKVKTPPTETAKLIFDIREQFQLDELTDLANALAGDSFYDRMAIAASLASIAGVQRGLAETILSSGASSTPFRDWFESNKPATERISNSIAEVLDSGNLTLAKLTVVVATLRELGAG